MNREDFGQLVAALRQDLGWTQFKLAMLAEVDEPVISQVERGVKQFVGAELLFSLANALQLTTLERREFLIAASGLDERRMVRQAAANVKTDVFDHRKLLERLVQLTGAIRLPAFLVDVYGDIIAANMAMIAFYEIPPAMMASAAQIPGGFNIVRVNFGRDLVGRNRITQNWEGYALNAMRALRVNSLRYRARPYFKYLMKAFRNPVEFPFFERFWNLVTSTEQDKDTNVDVFSYAHPDLGELNYIASSTNAVTSYGELFLVQNIPLDDRTSEVFAALLQKGGAGVIRFASWPEKSMS
jgi:transcriptional regulator with XRE-family HTH domain